MFDTTIFRIIVLSDLATQADDGAGGWSSLGLPYISETFFCIDRSSCLVQV